MSPPLVEASSPLDMFASPYTCLLAAKISAVADTEKNGGKRDTREPGEEAELDTWARRRRKQIER